MRITNLHSREYTQFTEKIWPGDIGAVVQTGLVQKLATKLILPPTEFFHFFLVADYAPVENDFAILESIPSHGVAVGRLSWYLTDTVAIFRPAADEVARTTLLTPKELGQRAVWQATSYGRYHYDYRICVSITYRTITKCFDNWRHGMGFNANYIDYPLSKDKAVICSKLVDEAYYDLFPVFDRRYEVLPANFLQQYLDGMLDHVCGWTGK